MKKNHWQRRHIVESVMKAIMFVSFLIVAGALGLILWTIISRGLPALNWDMITKVPKGGFYMGKEGGVLNAIIGSLYLAVGGTILAMIFSLPIVLYLKAYLGDSQWGQYVRLSLDVLWGIPSIVYGAFGFTLMIAIGLRASLLAGIIVLALVELPIMTRAMDEVVRRMPVDLEHAALALGSTKYEVALKIVIRQML
ncbi:MAG TPA: ABC transporter permease subunit, partial [Anaerolineales bacterium]|nr:ABC transporter permease subunit [Anaerolineales bacterium]